MIPFNDLSIQRDKIRDNVLRRINKVLDHGQFIMGPEVFELEETLQEYTGAKHCITTANGTDSLILSLMALDVGPGDEVITTAFSFGATAEAIKLVGAKPVFVDIREDTFTIDPSLIPDAITSNTRAIITVSIFGLATDIDEINNIANRHSIPVIEDAAQSFGASYKGRKSCNLTTIGCTSFFPSKPLGCYGDGGALFTSDDVIAYKVRKLKVHGQTSYANYEYVGLNSRLDTMQATVLLEKIQLLDEEIATRNVVAQRYNLLLTHNSSKFIPQKVDSDCVSSCAQYTLLSEHRENVIKYARKLNFSVKVYYPNPIYKSEAYKENIFLPITEKTCLNVFSIPFSPYIGQHDQSAVIEGISRSTGTFPNS